MCCPPSFIYQYITCLRGAQLRVDVEPFIRCCDRTPESSVQACVLHNSWLGRAERPLYGEGFVISAFLKTTSFNAGDGDAALTADADTRKLGRSPI